MSTTTAEPLAAWEVELMLPASLDLTHRCDSCGAAALHGVMIPAGESHTLLLFCNHHWRKNRVALGHLPHTDYRMTPEDAAKANAEALAAYEEAQKRAQNMRNVTSEPNYREIPKHMIQWDVDRGW